MSFLELNLEHLHGGQVYLESGLHSSPYGMLSFLRYCKMAEIEKMEKLKNRHVIKIIKGNLNFKIINCIPEVN